jgi:SNF family Na+-dependent transporter
VRSSSFVPGGLGTVVGAAGGLVFHALGYAGTVPGLMLGGLYGLTFALLVGRRATSPGAGLFWGLAFFLLLWLAGPATLFPMLTHTAEFCSCGTARAHFAELVAYLVCFGLPLGLALGLVAARSTGTAAERAFSLARAIIGGGVAGVVGGWAFGRWMSAVNFFPSSLG